ncbi:MAG: hypothetical protein F6K61_21495 [Sphaerospermopsis sp. SIO1G1]|nr:hypothetical protein [Sphaerospermopsis sp. SIO1G1]
MEQYESSLIASKRYYCYQDSLIHTLTEVLVEAAPNKDNVNSILERIYGIASEKVLKMSDSEIDQKTKQILGLSNRFEAESRKTLNERGLNPWVIRRYSIFGDDQSYEVGRFALRFEAEIKARNLTDTSGGLHFVYFDP